MAKAKPVVRRALVIDASLSMLGIKTPTIGVLNSLIDGTKRENKKTKSRITIVQFSDYSRIICEDQDPEGIEKITDKDYIPGGNTDIFSGIQIATDSLKKFGKPQDVYLVNVITDGEHNQNHHRVAAVAAEMNRLIGEGNWTITFQMPKQYVENFIRRYGFKDNIDVWEATEQGAKDLETKTSSATAGFYENVRRGKRATKEFFQTDLSKVKAKDLKGLEDVTTKFKSYVVDKEAPIKEFVEAKTKKGYVVGSTYYALTKREKIQASKEILLLNINTKALYGGPEARELIGLSVGQEAFVEPGNHSNFVVFVKSTSVNRKLVRGTKVLIDKAKIKNDAPTWDHTKVAAN